MKKFIATLMAVVMMFSMAACGTGSNGDEAGGESEGESGGETIKVGVLANTSGDNAMYGNAVANGVNLYIDQLNASGGINGKQVEVVQYDDEGDATTAVNAFNRLMDDGVTAVIGSVLTGTTVAVADETYEVNMPQITASATAAGVTVLDPEDPESEIRTNVFRSCFIDPFQGEKMAQYAYEKSGATTAAVIFETGSSYSEGLATAFVDKCEELGVEVVASEGYSTGDTDFNAQLTNIAAQNPDVIFCPNYYEDIGLIVTQARAAGITSQFLGGDGWGGVAGYASAEDMEGSVYCSGYAPGSTDEVIKFEQDYEAAYGEAVPNMFAPLGYDAAMLMCNAIAEAEAQGLETGSDEYKQAIIDAMAATDGLEGITGTYVFDEQNNPVKSAAMIVLKDGQETFSELY